MELVRATKSETLTSSLDLRRENDRFSSEIVGIIKSDRAFPELFTNLYSRLKTNHLFNSYSIKIVKRSYHVIS